MDEYILGIDMGTTSVKVCVVNVKTNEIVDQVSKDTQANVPSDRGIGGNKQDVGKIISTLNICMAKLQKKFLQQVVRVGICGQMHGVMFWNSNSTTKAWERIEKDNVFIRYDVTHGLTSALYTWQDSRCDAEFLANLPLPQSHLRVYTGYGVATIFWMAKHRTEKLSRRECCGTIQDFTVAMLCNLEKPTISDQNAASWGYYNCVTHEWNIEVLSKEGFPTRLLPNVLLSGEIAGYLHDNWHSVPKGTPIGVGLGDLQCSVLSTVQDVKDAVLNISTSAQIAFVVEKYTPPDEPPQEEALLYIPYFRNNYLVVAASLNGGNVLATFVRMVQQWSMSLGFSVPQSKIWETVINLGLNDDSASDLQVQPTCMGERHAPDMAASVTNINIGNLDLGKVFRALCKGLVANLHSMMSKEVLQEANITRIVGNGSGLSRNQVLQKEVQQLYQLPLVFTTGGDAAKGAAMAMHLDLETK